MQGLLLTYSIERNLTQKMSGLSHLPLPFSLPKILYTKSKPSVSKAQDFSTRLQNSVSSSISLREVTSLWIVFEVSAVRSLTPPPLVRYDASRPCCFIVSFTA